MVVSVKFVVLEERTPSLVLFKDRLICFLLRSILGNSGIRDGLRKRAVSKFINPDFIFHFLESSWSAFVTHRFRREANLVQAFDW